MTKAPQKNNMAVSLG